jgi:hypothetical protein
LLVTTDLYFWSKMLMLVVVSTAHRLNTFIELLRIDYFTSRHREAKRHLGIQTHITIYSARRLMGSRLIESAPYYNQILLAQS